MILRIGMLDIHRPMFELPLQEVEIPLCESMILSRTVPIPLTSAYLPFATRILLKGTLEDSELNTLRSDVQLEVAPESMIH